MHLNALKPKNLGPLTKKRLKLNFLLIKLLGKIFFCSEKTFWFSNFLKLPLVIFYFKKKIQISYICISNFL